MSLDPKEKEVMDVFLKEAEDLDSPLLFLLHKIQEEWGVIGQDKAAYLSKTLGIPMTRIYSAATFYEEFTIGPKGSNVIRICRGVVCHANGSSAIMDAVGSRLQIEDGETTPDGMFTLIGSSCIGQCDGSPAMMINDTVHGNVNSEKALKLIDDILKGGE